ncbi:DoxX family protein [Polymorphobacter sp. PAMC 29334]|uniref:DoxX family protein n=1 Tax=Polymorphobacter sp. PAMC 29334 TaxID=2862331 RepID=UPI001C662EAA|nr:DoxX family protein [Polymorphobacter sp. PAMC 29334]QYE36362.1 DoxX family protein [Polymorphobacter sp. PAMC 29334]
MDTIIDDDRAARAPTSFVRADDIAWAWPTGRILMALLFGISGLLKFAFHAPIAGAIASKGLPVPDLLAWGAALLECAGAAALVLGFRLRATAAVLAIWSLLTAILFHAFWAAQGMEQQTQLASFLKNIAIIGGLMVVAYAAPRHRSAITNA